MKPKYQAVIFDCDGVLVDTESLSTNTLYQMAREVGAPIDLSYAQSNYIGKSLELVLKDLESKLKNALPPNFEAEFRRRTFQAFKEHLKPIEGVKDLLHSLDLPKAVASNGPGFKMELTLGITGLQDFFGEHVYSAYDIQKWKPLPDLYWYAAKKLNFSPDRCVVIEDSLPGVEAAVRGGFDVFAFCPNGVHKELFKEMGAHVFTQMKELKAIFEEH